MNCSQPRHVAGLAAPAHVAVGKKLVLTWSEYLLATPPPVSLTTPTTFSNVPSAADGLPVTRAAKSVPLPTVKGRTPCFGPNGIGRGVTHGSSRHVLLR